MFHCNPKHRQKGMIIIFIDVFIPGDFEQYSCEGADYAAGVILCNVLHIITIVI